MCTSFEQPTVMWQVQTQFNALKRHPPILRRYDDMIILCVHCLSQKGIFLTGLCTASVLQLHTLFLRVGFQLRGCTVPLCVESQRGWQERGRKLVLLRKLSMVDGNIKISSLLAMNIVHFCLIYTKRPFFAASDMQSTVPPKHSSTKLKGCILSHLGKHAH